MIEAPEIEWSFFRERLKQCQPVRQNGRVEEIIGLVIESRGPTGSVGDLCEIISGRTGDSVPAEIVGFRQGRTLLMTLGELSGISPGMR